MIHALVRQMKKEIDLAETWLDAAEAYAAQKKFESSIYPGLRLAPDQFSFTRQIQSLCDVAKFAAARLSAKEPPVHADGEQTLGELRARLKSVASYLDGFSADDFEGAEKRTITQARWEGKSMTGADYCVEYALPNFFFHLSHAYAILRHNGVPLGKRDFLGELSMRSP